MRIGTIGRRAGFLAHAVPAGVRCGQPVIKKQLTKPRAGTQRVINMWSILNGTVVNALAVAAGCTVGKTVSGRISHRYQRIILDTLGLITVTLGIDAAVVGLGQAITRYTPVLTTGAPDRTYGARLGLVMVGSLVAGGIAGTALRLHERVEGVGDWLRTRFGGADGARFTEGFLTASVIFCVGPLTLLGCLQNATAADPSYLYIKSLLDGFCAIALTATLGLGVAFSIITVLVFQGGLTILFWCAAHDLPDLSIRMTNVVGGVMLLATALMILEIKRIPVANMLPSLAVAPIVIWIVEGISPGLLITPPNLRLVMGG